MGNKFRLNVFFIDKTICYYMTSQSNLLKNSVVYMLGAGFLIQQLTNFKRMQWVFFRGIINIV